MWAGEDVMTATAAMSLGLHAPVLGTGSVQRKVCATWALLKMLEMLLSFLMGFYDTSGSCYLSEFHAECEI